MTKATVVMLAVLNHLSEWLRPNQLKRNQTGSAAIFIFTVGPQLRLAETAILEPPGSKTAQSIPLNAFLREARSLKDWYVSKVPLLTPDAPLSRMLHPQAIVETLKSKTLSTILGKAVQTGRIASEDSTDGEYFCWSLMNHVLAYPYYHPDGYVRGTREFHDWHISIQKQYALLLYQQFAQKEQLLERYNRIQSTTKDARGLGDWILIDARGIEQLNAEHDLQSKLEKAEEDYRAIVRKISAFRAEQKMLQKAFSRTINACLGPASVDQGPSYKTVTSATAKGTRSSMVLLQPLNPSHKRKANQNPSRQSTRRIQGGHIFARAQKKQRKTSHWSLAAEAVIDAIPYVSTASTENNGLSENEDEATADQQWEVVEHDRSTVDAAPEADTTLESITFITAETLSHASSGHLSAINDSGLSAHPSGDNMNAITSMVGNMEVQKDESRSVSEDLAKQLSLAPQLDVFEDVEAMLVGLEWELDQVNIVRCNIELALQEADPKENLSAEEISAAISNDDVHNLDLVDQFADRAPDTTAGITVFREMIDDGVFLDESSNLVYRSGPAEFGGMLED